jgi:TPR repeat protein
MRRFLVLGSWFLGVAVAGSQFGCVDSAPEPGEAASETQSAKLGVAGVTRAESGATADEPGFDFEWLRQKSESERPLEHIDGCEKGSARACYELGDMLHGGDDIVRDNDLSVALIDHACQDGYMRACYDMGVRFYLGAEVDQDLHASRAYFQHGCEQGTATACHMLGRIAREGVGVEVDLELAQRYAKRACELGYRPDCHATWPTQAQVGEHEATLPADATDEVAGHARVCDSGLMSGCVALARAYEFGVGVSPNWNRAFALYESACDWGRLDACEVFREGKE